MQEQFVLRKQWMLCFLHENEKLREKCEKACSSLEPENLSINEFTRKQHFYLCIQPETQKIQIKGILPISLILLQFLLIQVQGLTKASNHMESLCSLLFLSYKPLLLESAWGGQNWEMWYEKVERVFFSDNNGKMNLLSYRKRK